MHSSAYEFYFSPVIHLVCAHVAVFVLFSMCITENNLHEDLGTAAFSDPWPLPLLRVELLCYYQKRSERSGVMSSPQERCPTEFRRITVCRITVKQYIYYHTRSFSCAKWFIPVYLSPSKIFVRNTILREIDS